MGTDSRASWRRSAAGFWKRHLATYLDEFVFRYNRRRNLTLAFQTLLGLGLSRAPTTYATIRGAQDQ